MSTNNVLNINKSIIERSVTFGAVLLNANVDITADVIDIEINFSLSGFASGYLTLNDTDFNVFQNYSIYRGDTIAINVISEISKKQFCFKTFIIDNIDIISKNIKMSNSKNQYRISFISPIMFLNEASTISHGFKGTYTTSQISAYILNEKLGLNGSGVLEIYDNNVYVDDYIITYRKPLEELQFLKIISNDSNEKDFFLLFEGINKIKFVPISMLLGVAPTIKLDRSISPDMGDKGIPITKIVKDRFVTGMSLSNIIKRGGLTDTYVHFDRDNKDIIESTYKLNEEYLNGIYTLGDSLFFSKEISNLDVMPTYKTHRTDGLYKEKFAYYNFRTSMLNVLREKIEMSGYLDLDVGSTVYVEFIQDDDLLSSVLTGTWLITELTWKISNRDKDNKTMSYPTFKMSITINKDTFGTTKDERTLKTVQNINNNTIDFGV